MFNSNGQIASNAIKTNNFTFCSPNVIYSTKGAFFSAKVRNGLLFGGDPAEYAESAEGDPAEYAEYAESAGKVIQTSFYDTLRGF
jgi:hypothetical protein